MYAFSRRAFSTLVKGAVEIYRGPDRLRFYRGFGLFCLGYTGAWIGLTYYQGWYKDKEREQMLRRFAELKSKIRGMLRFSSSTRAYSTGEKTTDDAAATANLPDSAFKKVELDPEGKTFMASLLAQINSISQQTKEYDKTLIPVFTALFGVLTFSMGVFLPRRMVRRLTLITRPPTPDVYRSASRASSSHLVEIETYGAFGFRAQGVRFQVPVDHVHGSGAPSDNLRFLQFYVDKVPFRFILEKEGADFRNPHEYDFVFNAPRD